VSDEIPPQFSPDGRYWWDGEQWIPVDQLPRPEPAPAATPPAWSTAGGPRRSPLPLILVASVVVVVLLIATVVGGSLMGFIHLPSVGKTKPTPVPTRAPIATPTPTPRTPVFPGVTAPDLLTYFSNNQIDCNPPVPDRFGHQWWYCSLRGEPPYAVGFGGVDPDHILQVQVQIKDPRPTPDENQAGSFLAAVAGLPYTGADPQQAQTWAHSHLNGGTIVIGKASFKIDHPDKASWSMSIYPLL
jgi:hypothetical protein